MKPEGTDINMFLKNALNNVNNNIQNVEKKIGAPSPRKDQVSPRMPPIQSARQQDVPVQEPAKGRVQPPQSAKQREPIQGAPKAHQPPQSARQAHSQQDWMKKGSGPKKEVIAEKPKKSEEESSAEKEKKDQERKKQRDEAMKQWRDKWQNKQSKDCVVKSADIPRDEKPVGPKVIERIKPKAVVKTCADWKAKDENAINEQLTKVTPTKMGGGLQERKYEPMKDILKENSPQPLRVNHMQVQQELDSVPMKQSLPKKCKSPPVVSQPKVLIEEVKQMPVQQIIAAQQEEEEEPENDIYKMLREMASLVRQDQQTPEADGEEEEDKNSDSSDSDDDDGFGQ